MNALYRVELSQAERAELTAGEARHPGRAKGQASADPARRRCRG
jgi:hypothetical protein